MCGIAGWVRRKGGAYPTADLLEEIFTENEKRGREAAGAAWRDDDGATFYYRKAKGTPADFFKALVADKKTLAAILRSPLVLLHARQPTKGTSAKVENNHPVIYKSWLVVHNGMVYNDDAIFEHYKMDRFAEVDTAAIPIVLDNGSTIEESAEKMSETGGSATIAAISTRYPDQMLIYRNGPPCDFYYDGHGLIIFSSAELSGAHIPKAFSLGGIVLTNKARMPDDHALIIGLVGDAKLLKVPRRPLAQTTLYSPKIPTIGGKLARAEAFELISWNPGVVGRPVPLLTMLGLLTWPTPETLVEVRIRASKKELEFLTPFGRWLIPPVPAPIEFRPHKRIRAWIKESELIEWWEPENGVEKMLMDGMGMLDEIKCFIKGPIGGKYTQTIYMCPWCGAVGFGYTWRSRKMRCEFCQIESRPPLSEKDNVLWKALTY